MLPNLLQNKMGLLHSCVLRNVLLSIIFYIYYLIVPITSYTNHTLEDDKVCGLHDVTRILTVGKDEKSAILIRATTYFSELSGKYPLKCSFVIEASFNQGLFAVIQKMKLRKHPVTNQCIDYVQLCHFKSNAYEKTFGFGYPKCSEDRLGPLCGEISLPGSGGLLNGTDPIGRLNGAFQNDDGGIGVKIFISNRQIMPNESLELVIAFTAYKACARNIGTYKMCPSTGQSNNMGSCIYKGFFNDGIVNCPSFGCGDECEINSQIHETMSTKVTLTAVTSIFLSFFLFLGCMWVCRYFEVLCWGMRNLRGGNCNQRNTHESVNVEDPFAPSAPSLPQNSQDKDLPPSYETLFPDR